MTVRRELMLHGPWWVLGLILGAGLLFGRTPTGDALGVRSFLTPQASSDWMLAQRFRMNANGLSAIEVRATAHGPVGGRYVLTLHDLDAPEVVRTEVIAATDLISTESYVFRFPRIEDSGRHLFHFEIAPVAADPGRGVAFWATKGERLDEGGLIINDQPRWASLAFHTHTSTVSLLRTLLMADDPQRPPQWLALVGLFGSWFALRFVLRAVATPTDRGMREVMMTSENDVPSRVVDGVCATPAMSSGAPEVPPAAVR